MFLNTSANLNGTGQVTLPGWQTTDGRQEHYSGHPEDTKETEEDLKPAGEMTQISIKEGGIKQTKIESCGRTWGRLMSNKRLSKADDDDDDYSHYIFIIRSV